MTSTVGKRNAVAILSLFRALNADPRAAQAEAKKGEHDGIIKKSPGVVLSRDLRSHTPCSSRLQSNTLSPPVSYQ